VMIAHESSPPWVIQYSPCKTSRADSGDTGRVELVLFREDTGTIAETREKEADIIAKRILSLVGNFQVTDRLASGLSEAALQKRPCTYMDIAILLRKRTHLKKFEDVFRRYGIPFVVVKGIGFYQEPEVAMLRALVCFLSNPRDDYSLYVVLKSPLFFIQDEVIIKTQKFKGESLLSRLKNSALAEKEVILLEECLQLLDTTPLSELIEKTLVRTKAWEYFYEAQKRANVKKFIRLIEDLESRGKSLFRIRDFLERTYKRVDEPKANVNTEGMDAVRIMTIHGSKGLEFPIVFVPGIEEPFASRTHDSLIYRDKETLYFKYIPESVIRKQDDDFSIHTLREEEEQKRLFYVVVTRAEEALFLVGQWHENNRSFLGFLKQGLGIKKSDAGDTLTVQDSEKIHGFSLISDREVEDFYNALPRKKVRKPQQASAEFIPVTIPERPQWKAVTETVNIRRQHGEEWIILGDVLHRIFEYISKGILSEKDVFERAVKLFSYKGIIQKKQQRLLKEMKSTVSLLKDTGIWQDIIMPREESLSEFPFILEKEKSVYTGRIDRVIKQNGVYNIYDYKTFPVQDREVGYLLRAYSFQLRIYREAIQQLFKPKAVGSFIVFTHRGAIEEIV
jgi:ATP-dependent exoDNAse (exonuclease V) beta subunit